MQKSEAEIVTRYADLVGEGYDPDLIRLVCDLDAGLTAVEPPAALWSDVPKPISGSGFQPRGVGEARGLRSWFTWRHLIPLPAMVTVLLILAAGATLAGANITNLGRPSNATPPDVPLGSFRHSGPVLRQHGKPELLFIGTSVDGNSAAESWPVVKALSQFGRWSGLRASSSRACMLNNGSGVQVNCKLPLGYGNAERYPEFDFSHARYASRYVVFVPKDLIDRSLHIHANLSRPERSLFNRYVRPVGYPGFRDAVWEAALGGSVVTSGRGLSLVAVGGYVETGANVVTLGDLETIGQLALPFATIQQSLQRGHAVRSAQSTLVPDVNVESNIITALICHADRGQPKHVCGRSVIREIVKHVK